MSDVKVQELLELLQQPKVKWSVVVVGVAILLRLKLILFALALPLLAYYYTPGAEGSEEPAQERPPAEHRQPDSDVAQDASDRSLQETDDDEAAPGANLKDLDDDEDADPYAQEFWGASREAANTAKAARMPSDDEDAEKDLGDGGAVRSGESILKPLTTSWDDEPVVGIGDDLDFPSERKPFGSSAPRGGSGFGNHSEDMGFDFLASHRDEESDMLGFGDSGMGRGKGKGKGKKGDKNNGKGDKGPSEANPRQVFVAGVADMAEEDIRAFFEDVGEVDRLKVLRQPDGLSKGVCFVTFRSEEQASKALTLHGTDLGGKTLVVRHAHAMGQSKGDKGENGYAKGDGKGRGAPDFGGPDRFGAAFGEDRPLGGSHDLRGPSSKGGRKGGGGGGSAGRGYGRGGDRAELDDALERALAAEGPGPVEVSDFDFPCRRFLSELRARDKTDGTTRFQDALEMVSKYTITKDRSAVRKWPAYIFMLLQKFDPSLWDEVRERDAERRQTGDMRPRRPMMREDS
mmetsp:Transcript_51979/g.96184  ORF Transcript_51979/g.96184 Transcript_51979/m.96184 type:complete len:516 (-) Transcript_51979:261-1808(-)